jgi:WD40 repeat protein
VQPLWSVNLGAPLAGLSLARERNQLLAWDVRPQLHLVDLTGRTLRSHASSAAVTAAAFSEDGSALVAGGDSGQVWWFEPDFTLRWEKKLAKPALAVALEPLGAVVAAADGGGGLALFDEKAQLLGSADSPRPLRFLAFVPEQPRLIGAADLGLVACFDAEGAFQWRDGLVANVGGLTVSGDGAVVALAAFSSGLICYRLGGPPSRTVPLPFPCRLAALSYDGRKLLAADPAGTIHRYDLQGKNDATYALPSPPVALALTAFADLALVALADGTLMALKSR